MKNKLKLFDNVSSVLWFLMDICWMLEFKLAVIMAPFVIITNLIPFILIRKQDVLPYLIAILWVFMNIFWMIPDYSDFLNLSQANIDQYMLAAKIFAAIGFLLMLIIAKQDFNLFNKFKRFKN